MAFKLERNLTAATATAIDGESVTIAPILYLDFPSLIKYYSGSLNNIVLTSSDVMPAGTYVGVGGISSISMVEDSSELQASTLVAELNGLDSTYIALVLAEQYFGRDGILGLAVLDGNYDIIGEPVPIFRGFISVLKANIEQSASIKVEIESILADWERPRVKRWNENSQNSIDSLDKGFDHVSRVIRKEISWG